MFQAIILCCLVSLSNITIAQAGAPVVVSSLIIGANEARQRAQNSLSDDPILSDLAENSGGQTDGGIGYSAPNFVTTNTGLNSVISSSPPRSLGYSTGFTSDKKIRVWGAGTFSNSKENDQKQKYQAGLVGIGYQINPSAQVGLLTQFDSAKETDTALSASVSSKGYYVGPYFVLQLPNEVIVDGRLAFGKSTLKISPNGTFTDSITTSKTLFSSNVSRPYEVGAWTVLPKVGVRHVSEDQPAYVNGGAITIGAQTIKLGQATAGASFSTEFEMDNGFIASPHVGLTGIWTFEDTGFFNKTTGTASRNSKGEFSGQLDFGFAISNAENVSLSISGFHEGLGDTDYTATGGKIKLIAAF
tara:strand:+ start:2272 stop:3345 length:1074 start_codon:yes stop_codon:yes gene_type:complete